MSTISSGKRRPGQKVAVALKRDGKSVTVTAELASGRAPQAAE